MLQFVFHSLTQNLGKVYLAMGDSKDWQKEEKDAWKQAHTAAKQVGKPCMDCRLTVHTSHEETFRVEVPASILKMNECNVCIPCSAIDIARQACHVC